MQPRRKGSKGSKGKIAFLIRSLAIGGAERQLIILACALQEQEWDVVVAVYNRGGAMEVDLQNAGVRCISLNKRGPPDVAGFLYQLNRFLRVEQPDILHSYLENANVLTGLIEPFYSRLKVVWGIRSADYDKSRYSKKLCLFWALERRLASRADLIIANSYAGKNYASIQGFPTDRISVISNGIDTIKFRPYPEQHAPMRAAWGISPDEILIGRVGRLDPMKDYPCLLRAVAHLQERLPNVRLVCVGDGSPSYKTELVDLTNQLGISAKVIWAGARKDTHHLYSIFDVSVSSSAFGEGFPDVKAFRDKN